MRGTVLVLTCASLFALIVSTAHILLPDSYEVSTIAVPQNTITNNTGGTICSGCTTLSNSQLIGIQVTQACLTMFQHNISNTCLPYSKLKAFDNTNPLLMGQWVSTPYYHRLAPHTKNFFGYSDKAFSIMVDPTGEFTTRAKMIIVRSDNFTYQNPDDVATNGIRIVHQNRVVTSCSQAEVAPIMSLVNDTIKYFENGCTKTSYNDTQVIKLHDTPFSFSNPYSTLHYDSMLKSIFRGHSIFSQNNTAGGLGPGNCITKVCIQPKDPFKNW